MDIGVHRLDLALWLMGYPKPVSVSGACYDSLMQEAARKAGAEADVEDLGCALIRFHNNATLILEASWAAHVREQQNMFTRLYGTRGGLLQKNTLGDYGSLIAEFYTEENGTLVTQSIDKTLTEEISSFHEFINSIVEKRPPAADGQQGMRLMQVLEAVYQSAALGREVTI